MPRHAHCGRGIEPALHLRGVRRGRSNRFTHAASQAVAQNPGRVYNPLFVFGLGARQDDLLHAIGPRCCATAGGARGVRLAEAVHERDDLRDSARTALAFRNKYRNVDVLLIDDIQFLAGREHAGRVLPHLQRLRDSRKQIVVTPPTSRPRTFRCSRTG